VRRCLRTTGEIAYAISASRTIWRDEILYTIRSPLAPQRLRRIHLLFREEKEARTQEFALHWSPTADGSSRDIVRQQYHFSPSGASEEIQVYRVELEDVVPLEVTIVLNKSGGDAYASLAELLLAGNCE
jgi:hypothetical protein